MFHNMSPTSHLYPSHDPSVSQNISLEANRRPQRSQDVHKLSYHQRKQKKKGEWLCKMPIKTQWPQCN